MTHEKEPEALESLDFVRGPYPTGWTEPLTAFFSSPAGNALTQKLKERMLAGATVFPSDPLRVLREITPEDTRVVILGQDPYHGQGQAVGIAFSVPQSLKRLPPSLKNIFKEIAGE